MIFVFHECGFKMGRKKKPTLYWVQSWDLVWFLESKVKRRDALVQVFVFREPGFVSEAKPSQSAELGVNSLGGKIRTPRGASQVALVAMNPPANAGKCKRCGFDPWVEMWVEKIPWMKAWQPTAVVLLGESHRQRSLTGYRPWGHRESNTLGH